MKRAILLVLFFISVPSLYGDNLTAQDIISAKKFLSEANLLETVQNTLEKQHGYLILKAEDFDKMRLAGFSEGFLVRMRELQQKYSPSKADIPRVPDTAHVVSKAPDQTAYCQIAVMVRPSQGGKVLFTPELDSDGKIPAGTEVYVKPEAKAPYLFDHWEGDWRGYQPMRVRVTQNLCIIAIFREPAVEQAPPKIEDPENFKDTRRAGYIYKGEVMGMVEGRGQNKDWGIAAEMDYKYLYTISYKSEVIANDGFRIRERRTFETVQEMLLLSKYQFHLDIKDDWQPVKQFINSLSEVSITMGKVLGKIPEGHVSTTGKLMQLAGAAAQFGSFVIDASLAKLERINFNQNQVEYALDKLEKWGKVSESIKKLKTRFNNPDIGRILGYPPNMKALEGKTFELEYEDGIGLVRVDIADEGQILTAQEKELLQRAFLLSDYYIFRDQDNPRRALRVGDRWQVDARTLTGVLDPRLRHRAEGTVQLYRDQNREYQSKTVALFRLERGLIKMIPRAERKKVEGEVAFTQGQILYDLGLQYVIKADLAGTATYREISTDHLLFGSRLSTEPRITVRYECSCAPKNQ